MFHYYSPFQFTHQGAAWINESAAWLGTEWMGTEWMATEDEMQDVRRDFDRSQKWAERSNIPLYMGEFGGYDGADMAARQRWTTFVFAEAEARGFAFAYWNLPLALGPMTKARQSGI